MWESRVHGFSTGKRTASGTDMYRPTDAKIEPVNSVEKFVKL